MTAARRAEDVVIHDLDALLAARGPLIDVRAPAEFARGAFDHAVNLPLLDDEDRRQVGIRYKQAGQQAAIALGERLVCGARRAARIQAWVDWHAAHPGAALYCWRGGLRSEIAQRWARDAGAAMPRVAGGFKALRTYCVERLDHCAHTRRFVILAGRTGSGKTRLLRTLAHGIDLEAMANHRGSAFGGEIEHQPTPIHFENRLAIAMRVMPADRLLVLEDESRTIGRLALPLALYEAMQAAPLVLLEAPLPDRVGLIFEDYVVQPISRGTAPEVLATRYLEACNRIRRRLGGVRHKQVVEEIAAAFATPLDAVGHRVWIEHLLDWYYDPMYDYQIAHKHQRIVFRGDASAVGAYLSGL